MAKHSKAFLKLCASINAKRPKTVINHILEHGYITTEELSTLYGYNHPPRAARDVRENGIPLETFKAVGPDGRRIAAYRFGNTSNINVRRSAGRTALSQKIKTALIDKYGCRCSIYLEYMNPADLQIDHRVPFEVAGDPQEFNPEDFMLLSGSANRAKSWSCERCENWTSLKDKEICLSCYWAYPEDYQHIAMRQIRRIDLLWQDSDVHNFEKLKKDAQAEGHTIPEFVKIILHRALGK